MPHYPIVAQQEAEVMLPRKPNMWQYVYLQVLFESLFSSTELFNMTMFRNFEVMLRHTELLCVEFC
jgi:hypothetical protein